MMPGDIGRSPSSRSSRSLKPLKPSGLFTRSQQIRGKALVPYVVVAGLCTLLLYSLLGSHSNEGAVSAPTMAAQRTSANEEQLFKQEADRDLGLKIIENQHQAVPQETARQHTSQLAEYRGAKAKQSDPFASFSCTPDELGTKTDDIYAAPFRFHVYQDMPKELLDDVIERAQKYWMPEHSNNQFVTEIGLAKYLPLHPCHTDDPSLADAFIVPVQTVSMIWLEKEAGRKDGGRTAFAKVMRWLETKETYRRTKGRDHYATAIAWDTGRRPFGELNLLGPEVPTAFQNLSTFGIEKYMRAQHDIVVPYPDPDSIAYYTEDKLKSISKKNLAVFVGSMVSTAPIRRVIHDQMYDFNSRNVGSRAIWRNLAHQDSTQTIRDLLPTALFGPVMAGDSYSSRRLFSLIFAGTIPVIICDRLMLPYEDIIDYSSFSVFFSEQELLDDPDTNIMDILDAMASSEIKRLQENGRKVKKHFIYHDGAPEPGDAFDMFVRQLAQVNLNNRRLKNMLRRVSAKTLSS